MQLGGGGREIYALWCRLTTAQAGFYFGGGGYSSLGAGPWILRPPPAFSISFSPTYVLHGPFFSRRKARFGRNWC